MEVTGKIEKAVFGAGCFWGAEVAFLRLKGVKKTEVGFMGGSVPNPSYEDVCKGNTGHIEIVKIYYDRSEISYEELLKVFWSIHDPTQFDRQGHDVGHQYRSVIFFYTPEQEYIAKKSKAELESWHRYPAQIVTQILPAGPFYLAEEYHQQYLKKQGLLS